MDGEPERFLSLLTEAGEEVEEVEKRTCWWWCFLNMNKSGWKRRGRGDEYSGVFQGHALTKRKSRKELCICLSV